MLSTWAQQKRQREMTQSSETIEIYTPEEASEQLDYNDLTPTDKWLAFRVRSRIVDDMVTGNPDGIDLQVCFDAVDDEIVGLHQEAEQSLAVIAKNIEKALRNHGVANGFHDYTERDVANLQARYQECKLQDQLLLQILADRDGLERHTEKLVGIVRQSAYDEAMAILREKADSALQERSALEGQNATFLQKNIALQEENITLQGRMARLQAEIDMLRDGQTWDRELADVHIEADTFA